MDDSEPPRDGDAPDVMALLRRAQAAAAAKRPPPPPPTRQRGLVGILGQATTSLLTPPTDDDAVAAVQASTPTTTPAAPAPAPPEPPPADVQRLVEDAAAVLRDDGGGGSGSASLGAARRDALRRLAGALLRDAGGGADSCATGDITAADGYNDPAVSGAAAAETAAGAVVSSTAAATTTTTRPPPLLPGGAAWAALWKPLTRRLADPASPEGVRLGAARLLAGLLARGAHADAAPDAVPRALPRLLPALTGRLAQLAPATGGGGGGGGGGWVLEPRQQLFYRSRRSMVAVARGRVTPGGAGWSDATTTATGGGEPSECVRAALLGALAALLSAAGRAGSAPLLEPYAGELAGALHAASRDACPDVRVAACGLIVDLCTAPSGAAAGESTAVSDSAAYDAGDTPFRGQLPAAVAAVEAALPPELLPPHAPATCLRHPGLLAPAAVAMARSLAGVDGADADAAATASVHDADGPGLWHRLARVRTASVAAVDALVRCRSHTSAGGSAAILSLLGARDANTVSVAAFYGTASSERNALARLLTDGQPGVRAGALRAVGRWLTALPDRADWAPRLLPYLLSFAGDAHPALAGGAASLLHAAGVAHLAGLGGRDAARALAVLQGDAPDGDPALAEAGVYARRLPAPLADGAALAARPPLPARMLVRAHAGHFLPALTAQLAVYAPFGQGHGPGGLGVGVGAGERTAGDTRHRAAVLLAVTAAHAEERLLADPDALRPLLPALVDALAAAASEELEDDEGGAAAASLLATTTTTAAATLPPPLMTAADFSFRAWVGAAVELVGRFAPPGEWAPALSARLRAEAAAAAAAAGEDDGGGPGDAAGARAAAAARALALALPEALPARLQAPAPVLHDVADALGLGLTGTAIAGGDRDVCSSTVSLAIEAAWRLAMARS